MKKVAILAAPGFEEIELMAPLDILRRLNMDLPASSPTRWSAPMK